MTTPRNSDTFIKFENQIASRPILDRGDTPFIARPVFILANFLKATAFVLDSVLLIYMWIIIIRALASWLNPDPYNPIVQFLYSITEPVMYRVRQVLPMSGMGIDFSPLIIILAIMFLRMFLVQSLDMVALRLA